MSLWVSCGQVTLGSIRLISSCPCLGGSPPYGSHPTIEAVNGLSSFLSPSLLGLGVGLRPHRLGGSQALNGPLGDRWSVWGCGQGGWGQSRAAMNLGFAPGCNSLRVALCPLLRVHQSPHILCLFPNGMQNSLTKVHQSAATWKGVTEHSSGATEK